MRIWQRGSGTIEPQARRPRLRKARLLADLQTQLDHALKQLEAQQKITFELARDFDRHESAHEYLERRLTALEERADSALGDLAIHHERHQQYLARLANSIERQRDAIRTLDQMLDVSENSRAGQ